MFQLSIDKGEVCELEAVSTHRNDCPPPRREGAIVQTDQLQRFSFSSVFHFTRFCSRNGNWSNADQSDLSQMGMLIDFNVESLVLFACPAHFCFSARPSVGILNRLGLLHHTPASDHGTPTPATFTNTQPPPHLPRYLLAHPRASALPTYTPSASTSPPTPTSDTIPSSRRRTLHTL